MHVRECQNETHSSVQHQYAKKIIKSHSSKGNPSLNYFPNAGCCVLKPNLGVFPLRSDGRVCGVVGSAGPRVNIK